MIWIIKTIACLLVADFVTGVVHFLEDTMFVSEFNLAHHKTPLDHAVRKASDAYYLPFRMMVWSIFFGLGVAFASIRIEALLVSAFLFASPMIHGWAHGSQLNNPAVRFLQAARLIQRPNGHRLHHSKPYDGGYCVLTGWLNPLLDRSGFWRVARKVVS